MADLINLMLHFYSTELFALEAIFLFEFWVFFSVPHLVGIYANHFLSITEPPCLFIS